MLEKLVRIMLLGRNKISDNMKYKKKVSQFFIHSINFIRSIGVLKKIEFFIFSCNFFLLIHHVVH